jgi:hypothetical protein
MAACWRRWPPSPPSQVDRCRSRLTDPGVKVSDPLVAGSRLVAAADDRAGGHDLVEHLATRS